MSRSQLPAILIKYFRRLCLNSFSTTILVWPSCCGVFYNIEGFQIKYLENITWCIVQRIVKQIQNLWQIQWNEWELASIEIFSFHIKFIPECLEWQRCHWQWRYSWRWLFHLHKSNFLAVHRCNEELVPWDAGQPRWSEPRPFQKLIHPRRCNTRAARTHFFSFLRVCHAHYIWDSSLSSLDKESLPSTIRDSVSVNGSS